MKGAKAASRYARALLDLAIEKGTLDTVNQDMLDLVSTCDQSADLANLLRSPIIDAKKKREIFEKLFGSSMSEMSIGFINLIINKSRENILVEIASSYVEQYKQHMNIMDVTIVSASPLQSETKDKIIVKVKENFNGTIQLSEKVDESLVGGFIVKMGDTQIDASIASQLTNLNNILLN